MSAKKRVAILTGGGDCPGINAVIRAVVKKAILEYDMEIVGVEDGYHGLVNNRCRKLTYNDVSGLLTLGGTILGTSKIANPYRYAIKKSNDLEFRDLSSQAVSNFRKMKASCLVCIGGDGTLGIGHRLLRDGIPVVGVPKTIDNDIRGTDLTFGFDSAVSIATEGIDRIHTTAQSHHRVMIVEVMGHRAGWIALHSGVAGGGDIILIPEIPYDINVIIDKVRERSKKGKRFSIVVAAEGARPKGGDVVIKKIVKASADSVRLGGIGFMLAEQIEKLSGVESRAVSMGHLQRGGTPTPFDRVLATQLGAKAAEMAAKGRFGYMAALKGRSFVEVSLADVAKGPKLVDADNYLLNSACCVGTCFGT